MGWSWSLYFCRKFWFTWGPRGPSRDRRSTRQASRASSCLMRTTARLVRGESCLHRLDARQVQREADKIAETARAAGLFVHLVTKASSKDEFLGLSFDGVFGRVSVESRRIWMRKLAIGEALRRSALSGASLRLSRVSDATSMSFDPFKCCRL